MHYFVVCIIASTVFQQTVLWSQEGEQPQKSRDAAVTTTTIPISDSITTGMLALSNDASAALRQIQGQ